MHHMQHIFAIHGRNPRSLPELFCIAPKSPVLVTSVDHSIRTPVNSSFSILISSPYTNIYCTRASSSTQYYILTYMSKLTKQLVKYLQTFLRKYYFVVIIMSIWTFVLNKFFLAFQITYNFHQKLQIMHIFLINQ